MRFLASLTREPPWLIKPRELEVLRSIQHGVVNRNPLYGDLAPWMLGKRQVSWSVTLLILHGLVICRGYQPCHRRAFDSLGRTIRTPWWSTAWSCPFGESYDVFGTGFLGSLGRCPKGLAPGGRQ
jgi:hypothetical protein